MLLSLALAVVTACGTVATAPALPAPVIARIQIVGIADNSAEPIGRSIQLSVKAYDASGAPLAGPAPSSVAWSTSDSTIARVDAGGVLLDMQYGSVEIYARVTSGASVLVDSARVLFVNIDPV